MKKRDEISDPKSCLNKAHDDDWVFVLKQSDPVMPDAIRDWAKRRIALGLNSPEDDKIAEALRVADEVEIRQGMH